MSGAPEGNTNATKGAQARQALIKAIEAKSTGEAPVVIDKMQCLVDIWTKQIDQALEGNTHSASMIIDRIDGKPKQALVGGGEDDRPISFNQVINFVGVDVD